MQNEYMFFLRDLITIISDDYNNALIESKKEDIEINYTNNFLKGKTFAYYTVLDTIHKQLIAFQLNEEYAMVEPILDEEYNPFGINT